MSETKSGWNRSTGKSAAASAGRRAGKSRARGVVAAVIVVLGAVVAWLFCSSPSEEKVDGAEKRVNKIREVKPAVSRKAAVTNVAVKVVQQKPKDEKPAYVKKPGQMQLPNGKILTFPPPKEGHTRKVFAGGRLYECDHLGNFKDVTKRNLFNTAFEENFLRLAQEGQAYIPAFLTGLDEADVKKLLEKNYQPKGDETEEEKAALNAYDEMRCAALLHMEQGGKFDDFVNEYATFDRKQRETKAISTREIMMLYKEGKVAEAKQMAEAANVLMEQKGYKPIMLPDHVRRAFNAIPAAQ